MKPKTKLEKAQAKVTKWREELQREYSPYKFDQLSKAKAAVKAIIKKAQGAQTKFI
jgi:hypothetical protein